MSSFTPSDVVDFIGAKFPKGKDLVLRMEDSPFVQGLVQLIDGLDSTVLPVGADLVALKVARAAMITTISMWDVRGINTHLNHTPCYNKDPVSLVRDVLEKCPDQAIPPSISGLEFISDGDLRSDLRSDIASIDILMQSSQWKAAMVICGSVAEALLLSVLQEEQSKEELLKAAKNFKKEPDKDATRWHLPLLADVAEHFTIISEDCLKQVQLAQEYRNLIHPGRRMREDKRASRAAALSSQAGLQHIVEELSERYRASVN